MSALSCPVEGGALVQFLSWRYHVESNTMAVACVSIHYGSRIIESSLRDG